MYNTCKAFYFTVKRLELSGRFSFDLRRSDYGGRRPVMAKNLEIALLFDFYGDMLTEKQRDVV